MTIEWNPYPETKPPKRGRYLISVDDADDPIMIDEYFEDVEPQSRWFDYNEDDVIAWAELPEPYEKPVRLKAYPIESIPSGKTIILIKNNIYRIYTVNETDFIKMDWTHWSPLPEFDFMEEE